MENIMENIILIIMVTVLSIIIGWAVINITKHIYNIKAIKHARNNPNHPRKEGIVFYIDKKTGEGRLEGSNDVITPF